ncbi:MAG: AAA family ATPase, partial [Nanoarchaeota archaeon]
YRQLGFHNNPFSIKPAAFHDMLFGYEELVGRVVQAVGSNEVIFIEGPYGEGKTTMLKHILRHFGGHKKVVYFSVNRVESRLQIRKLLNERYGRLGVWFDIRPKDMVLLLDEASDINVNDVEKLLKFKKDGNFRSIVFVSQSYNPDNMPEELKGSIKVFRLERLKDEDAVRIIRKRVGELPLLPDDMVKKIFAASNHNARELLKGCEALCKKAVDSGSERITDKMIGAMFGDSVVIQEEPEEEKIFLQIDEDSLPEENDISVDEKSIFGDPDEEEVEEEKPKGEMDKDWEDVSVEDDELAKERKELDEETEIDEELSKISLEEEDESEKKAKVTNGNSKKAMAMEEALGKSTDDLIDEHYY